MTDLATYISERTKRPDDFAYFGDLEFSDWASCFGHHRDSDVLEESNWHVVKADLESRYPDDVWAESYNHFLVGWVETLRIRVWSNHPNRLGRPIYSTAIHAAFDWQCALDNYPVADDDDYSQREWDDLTSYLETESGEWPDSIDQPDDWVSRVASLLEVSSADDVRWQDLKTAIMESAAAYFYEMNYTNPDQLTLTERTVTDA